jgi:hypothetical protein
MITLPHLAALFIIMLAYAVLCVLKPQRKCGRCKATPGRSQRFAGVAGAVGKCKRCNGHKKHPRRFAPLVHWFLWNAVIDPWRDRHSGQQFSYTPAHARRDTSSRTRAAFAPPGDHYAARLRAAQRADRLQRFQARLQARTAPRSWAFA